MAESKDDRLKPNVTIPNIIAAHTLNGVILNFINFSLVSEIIAKIFVNNQ